MKKKLTLTVENSVIEKARWQSKSSGKSISRLFEEYFDNPSTETNPLKTNVQKAAENLLEMVKASKSIETLDDKALLKEHAKRKYS